jgi:thiamine biosynthesis lipoprotein
MGTEIAVRVEHDAPSHLVSEVRDLFEHWEAVLSRFIPDSELSRVNAAAGATVRVSPLFHRVLTQALRAARSTGGVFDPTLGRQLVAAGYSQSFDLPSTAQFRLSAPRPGGAWRDIEIDDAAQTVRIPRSVALDFGGIAKGMAVDAAIAVLSAAGATNALVNAGGDMRAITSGTNGWPVGLTDVPGQFLTLSAGAVATSSTARRRWRIGSEDQHHLIDPRHGGPSRSGVWSVSVAADSCAQAEVAAKTAVILGPHEGPKFLDRVGLAGILSHDDGTTIRTGRWPSQEVAA